MTAGLGIITNALTRVLGAQFLRDVQTFVAAIDTLFGGFRQRAQQTFQLLQADGTAFLVVAAPEPDALREAAYFVERLSEDGMPLAGLVVNRATTAPTARTSATSDLSAEEQPPPPVVSGERSRTPWPRGCSGCTPTGVGWSNGRRACGHGSPPRTRRCPRRWSRRSPATSTTSTISVVSASSWGVRTMTRWAGDRLKVRFRR